MRITIVLAVSLLSGWFFLTSCNTVLAQDASVSANNLPSAEQINISEIGQSQIQPAHPLYFLKTIREYFELKFAPIPRTKMIRQLEFSTRRIREVKSLVNLSRQDLIEPTLERYWFHLKTVLDFRPRDEGLTQLLRQVEETHLGTLQNIYYKIQNKRAQISIRSSISRILEHSEMEPRVRLFGCDFLLREATSSALNEVEKAIYLERGKICRRVVYPKEL